MVIFDHRTDSPMVIDFGDGSFFIGQSDALPDEVVRSKIQPSAGKDPSSTATIIILLAMVAALHGQDRKAPMMSPMATTQAPITSPGRHIAGQRLHRECPT